MPIHPHVGTNSGSIQGLVARGNDLDRRLRALEANRTTLGAGSVTSTIIGPGSINTGHIQASAINASHISALSINASHIAALSIETGHIAALAVTAGKVAANAIEADKIAASAVTTVKLDAGAVTAAKIAANTITANEIAASAITADELAANAVTAVKISASAVEADKLAANSVTAAKIAANAITTDKILAGAVTAAKITTTDLAAISTNMGSITAGTITGATIQTAASGSRVVMDSTGLKGYALDGVTKVFEINAGSGIASFTGTATLSAGSVVPGSYITGTVPVSSVPAIGGGNLLPDSSLEASNVSGYWSVWDGATITPVIDATTAKYGTKSMTRVATGGNLIYFWRSTTGITVTPGDKVAVSGWYKGPSGTSIRVGFRAYNGAANLGDTVGTSVAMDGTWKRVTALLTVPATTTDIRYIGVTAAAATAGQQFWADALQMEFGEVATAYAPMVSEILPGTVVTSHLADGAITAGKLNVTLGGGNIARNAGLEATDSTTGNYGWGVSYGSGVSVTHSISAAGEGRGTGSKAYKSVVTAITTGNDSYNYGVKHTEDLPTGSGSWTVSGYFKATAGRTVAIQLQWYNGTTWTYVAATASRTATGGWDRVSVTLNQPTATRIEARFFQTTTGMVIGDTYWVDDIQFEAGDVVTSYAPKVSELLPGVVGTTQLADNAVTTAKITDGTITTAKIGTSQITNTLIADGSISTPKLQANAVTANEVAAGAITANKLNVTVGGGNLLSDSSFENAIAAWQVSVSSGTLTQDATVFRTGTKSFRFTATAGGARVRLSNANLIAVEPGRPYTFSCYVRSDVVSSRNAQMVVVTWDAGKTTPTTLTPSGVTAVSNTEWTRIYYTITPAAGNVWATPAPQITNSVNGEQYYIDDVQVEVGDVPTAYAPKVDEILPGTIVASMIAANSITANEIAASAITSSELAANAVVAGKIAAGTIVAADIAADTITAAQIAANAITASELAAGSVTANKLLVTMGGGNLLKDSSAEAYTGNWTVYLGTIASESGAGNVHGVGKSVKVTLTGFGGLYPAAGSIVPVVPGEVVTISAWVKPAVAKAVTIGGRYTAGGAYHSGSAGFSSTASMTWQRISTTLTIPAGVDGITPYISLSGGASGDIFYVDDMQVEYGDVLTSYAPKVDEILPGTIQTSMLAAGAVTANTIGAGAITAGKISAGAINAANLFVDGVITGAKLVAGTITATQIGAGAITTNNIAAGAITSQSLSITAGGGNLVTDGSFENVGTPGTLPPGTGVQGSGTRSFPNDGTAFHGTRYMRMSWTSTGILKAYMAPVFCRAGVTYTASIYVRGSSAGGISSMYFFTNTTSLNGSGTYSDGGTTSSNFTTPTLSTSWQRYSCQFTVASDRWVATGVRFANVASGDWAEFDAVQVEEGTTLTAFGQRLPGTISATQILPGSITTGQIMANTIVAGNIAAGTITATQIAANTITAGNLNVGVGSGNQVINSSFENSTSYLTGWVAVNATSAVESSIVHGTGKSAKLTTTTARGYIYLASGSRPTCDPGVPITASAWVYVPTARTIRLGLRTSTAISGGSYTGSSSIKDQSIPANTWTRIIVTRAGADVPAGTVAYDIFIQDNGSSGNVFYVDDIQGQSGDVATAWSPKPDEVLPGTIQAQHLSVSTLSAITADMGDLTAGTITGATIRTAASGPRVQLAGTDFTLYGLEQNIAQYPYFVNESGYWALIRAAWSTATWSNQIGYYVGEDYIPGPFFAPVNLPVGVAPSTTLTAARIKDINNTNVSSGAEITQTVRVLPSTSYKVGGKIISSRATNASAAITVTMEWLDANDTVLSTSTPTASPSTISRLASGQDLQQWNLIPNPSAEVNTTGWTSSGTTLTQDSAWANVGTYSFRTTKASVVSNDVSLYSPYVEWKPGMYGSARGVVRAHNAFGGNTFLRMEFWDATTLLGSSDSSLVSGMAAGATQTHSVSGTAPAGTTRMRLRAIVTTSGTQNVDVAWDAFRAGPGPSTGYFDGNSSGWSWTGVAGSSASTGFAAVVNDWTDVSATATSHASAAKLRFKIHVASASGDTNHETHFYGMYAVAAGTTYEAYKLNPSVGSVLSTSRLDTPATGNIQNIAWRDLSAPAGELAAAISGESGGINETSWFSNTMSLNVDAFVPSTFSDVLGNRGAKAKLRAVDPRRPSDNYAYLESVVAEGDSGYQSNILSANVKTAAGASSRVILGREETGSSFSDFAFAEDLENHRHQATRNCWEPGGGQYDMTMNARGLVMQPTVDMTGGTTGAHWMVWGQLLIRANSNNWTTNFVDIDLWTTAGAVVASPWIRSYMPSHLSQAYDGYAWATVVCSPKITWVPAGASWRARMYAQCTFFGSYYYLSPEHSFIHAMCIDHDSVG